MVKTIWCISDTHTKHQDLIIPEVDMVIFSGDAGTSNFTADSSFEVEKFMDWFSELPIKYKVWIAGNHDVCIDRKVIRPKNSEYNFIYLEHESVCIEGVNIFGSPYTPSFGHNWGFNVNRGKLQPYWSEIPDNTDILVTHGPPYGILDHTESGLPEGLKSVGDKELLNRVKQLNLKYHIFGHIHTEVNALNAGTKTIAGLGTVFVNASVLDLRYRLNNNGHIITWN